MKLLILSLSILFLTFTTHAQTPITKAAWLLDTWQSKSPNGVFTESWVKQNDTVYVGKGCMVMGKDTVFKESLAIKQRGNDLFYIPTVANQNGGQPIEFKLTSATKEQLVFENPTHDFPQKITYTQRGSNALVAEVSGVEKGIARSEKFELKRVR